MNAVNGLLAWLHGVAAAVKPFVAVFFSNVGAMIFNRPAPAGEVVVSAAILVVLLVLVLPKIIKAVTK